ncbi:uncharacterized protein LOC128192160 isoform X2 [Crassostrea angulata]|uniref:uncharacterized protein LOC128192160 isoform X2 n=1 Tax=Magallana angulata TaxID=2784310 RepID=UPI0022B125D4|nr:uncharacterized protein LOC128192160 isoform X2 [Crassostrea angulata]
MAATVPEGVVANGISAEDPEPPCSNGMGGCKTDIDDLKSKTESLVNGLSENPVSNGFHTDTPEVKNDSEANVNSDDKMELNSPIAEVTPDSGADTGNVESKDEKDGKDNKDEKEENPSRDSTPLSDVSSLTPGVSRSGTPISSQDKTEDIKIVDVKTEDVKTEQSLPVLAQEKVMRSSEERSMDSTDSGTSNKSSSSVFKNKTTPKARKSGPPAKNILPSALAIKSSSSSGENVKLNLPQFNNAITVDSKFLEKISKISSVKHDIKHEKTHTVLPIAKDNVENGGVEQKMKKSRASLPINSQPKVKGEVSEKTDDTLSDSSLLEKDAFGKVKKRSKKRRKMGAYKLPSEIKKKFGPKKKDGDTNSLKDEKEEDDSKVHVKSEEKTSHVQMSKKISSRQVSSPENGPRRSAWDMMKSPRVTPKGKNTLGSTRQKLTPNSDKSKAQTSLDSFLNRCDQKSSQIETQNKDISLGGSKDRRLGLRKRKKEDDLNDEDDDEGVKDKKESDTYAGNRKKRKEETITIVTASPSMAAPVGYQSLLTPQKAGSLIAPVFNTSALHFIATSNAITSSSPKAATTVVSSTLLPQNFTNIVPNINAPTSVSPGSTSVRLPFTKANFVTTGHAPLLLVPVNTSGQVVNAVPISTSLGVMTSTIPGQGSPGQKIILSVPDPKSNPPNKLGGSPPRYILMQNVASSFVPRSTLALGTPVRPQLLSSPSVVPLNKSATSSSSAARPNFMYSNQSFGEKPSVINNLSNKLDAVNKKDLESMDDDRSVSPSPSSLSYPVTPPKTPEDGSEDSMSVSSAPPGPIPPDKDVIPLCCCKINGACFKKLGSSVTYCQALDSVDGKVMGCCNKVTNSQLVRPGVKIPFMAICEAHRKRLKLHQCCPGCGHFCTQGAFAQCRKVPEGSSGVKCPVHHFHKQCQVLRNGRYFCPHCGEESEQFEVTLQLDEPRNMTNFEDKYNKPQVSRAKMGFHSNTYKNFTKGDKDPSEEEVTATHKAQDKTISTGGLPMGPDKTALENVLLSFSEERPRLKKLPKFLYHPAYEGDLDKFMAMIAEGFDINEKIEDFENQTPLHAACISGSLPIVHVLVQMGSYIHATDKELKTPLMYAAENNHLSIVKYLMKCKANIKQRAEDGMTVLHYAAKAGYVDVLMTLLESDDADVNMQDDGGWTPIIWASEHRIVPAVKFLIKHGADPNMKDKEENTSLHWAAYSGSVDIAEMFLNAGCDLETPNEHGDRPLHIAARQDHYECVVLFLARGADVDAKNKENDTPIECCIDENSQSALALKVNKQLKGFAAARLGRTERLIDRDVSRGRENIPMAVINGVDDDLVPTDFQYITENVETTNLNINRTISSLQSCRCSDDCSSMYCVCGRNSVKCWYDKNYHLLPDFNMTEPPLIFECNKGCRCWSTCNNRVVQNGITCRLQLVKTEGRGWGVKTLLDIPKGIFICEYIGELISDSEADGREDDSYLFDLDNRDGDTYCIDARRYGNISRFINHLCEPNIIPVKVFVDHQDLRFPRICFFSSREIKADEELGFDYGEKFWIIKWKQFTCACNSPKCKYSKDTIQKTLQEYRQRHEEDEPID